MAVLGGLEGGSDALKSGAVPVESAFRMMP